MQDVVDFLRERGFDEMAEAVRAYVIEAEGVAANEDRLFQMRLRETEAAKDTREAARAFDRLFVEDSDFVVVSKSERRLVSRDELLRRRDAQQPRQLSMPSTLLGGGDRQPGALVTIVS